MMTLVIGSSNSGKSSLAEQLCLETGDERRYYLATMQVLGPEGEARVQRHRAMREGKGFVTLERPLLVDRAILEMEDPEHCTVLLECVANLVGNTMHEAASIFPKEAHEEAAEARFADRVTAELVQLSAGVHHLIAVTDEYPAESPDYDAETRQYVRLLALVNERLKKTADRVLLVSGSSEDRKGGGPK